MSNYSDINVIPKMTGYTSPSGIAFANKEYMSSYPAWKAFNQVSNSEGFVAGGTSGQLGYGFENPIVINKYSMSVSATGSYASRMPKDWTFEGSNNSTTGLDGTWEIIDTQSGQVWDSVANETKTFFNQNKKAYKMYRINWTKNNGNSNFVEINQFKMYERMPLSKILLLSNDKSYSIKDSYSKTLNLIPIMTSNTTPSGIAKASSIASATLDAWKAFDGITTGGNSQWSTASSVTAGWLSYEFTEEKRVGGYSICSSSDLTRNPKSWTFEGWNGNDWIVLDKVVDYTSFKSSEFSIFPIRNTKKYKSYRLNVSANNGAIYIQVHELEMYEKVSLVLENIPSTSQQNLIKYGMDSPVQVDGIFTYKNYILQDSVSENAEGLLSIQLDRKPLSIGFN